MVSKLHTPLVLTACTALAVGVCVTAFLIPTAAPEGLEEPLQPSNIPTSIQEFHDERLLEVNPITSPSESLTARTSGTVTETVCKPGTTITSGSKLLSVDNRPLIALYTATPLYRELTGGEQGPDVSALQQELGRLGYSAEGNGIYGYATKRGVKALMKAVGEPNPDGSMKPADTVWIPTNTVTPVQCSVGLNSTISEGTEVVKTGGRLIGMSFQVPTDLHQGKRTFSIFDQKTKLAVLNGQINESTFLRAVEDSEGYRTWTSDPAKKPKATLSLTEPIHSIKVPPTAMFGQKGNKACVSTDGNKATFVTVIGSSLGATLILPLESKTEIKQVYLGQDLNKISCPLPKA